jgi:hypothetical protein
LRRCACLGTDFDAHDGDFCPVFWQSPVSATGMPWRAARSPPRLSYALRRHVHLNVDFTRVFAVNYVHFCAVRPKMIFTRSVILFARRRANLRGRLSALRSRSVFGTKIDAF